MSVFNVPVTIGVNETKIANEIENEVVDRATRNITEEIKRIIFARNYYGKKGYDEKDDSPLRNMVEQEVRKVIKDKEELIIEKATTALAEKMYKSKACKEAMKNTIEKASEGD